MQERKGFKLKYQIAFWNFGISVFSLIGCLKTFPKLFSNISDSFEGFQLLTKALFAMLLRPHTVMIFRKYRKRVMRIMGMSFHFLYILI
jgi:hypothetical protein